MWIFLSPHLDDAACSCGGLIRTRVAAGEEVAVWTLFAGDPPDGALSPFAEDLHARWGLVERSYATRRAEDERACGILGAGYRHFSYRDSIYRQRPDGKFLYPTKAHVFGRISRADRDLADRLVAELDAALPGDAGLVCPLGLGNHVDHMLTRLVAERLGRRLLYFEDLPYAAQMPDTPEANDKVLERAWDSVVTPLSDEAMEVWQSSVAAYASRLDFLWRSDADMRRTLVLRSAMAGGARLWQPRISGHFPAARPRRDRKKLLLLPQQGRAVSPRDPTGGSPASMFDLAGALHRSGAEVTVFAVLTENEDFELDGVAYHHIELGGHLQKHLSTLMADDYDAIIAHQGGMLIQASRYFPFAVRILRIIHAFWDDHLATAEQVNGSIDIAAAVSNFIARGAIEWGLRPEAVRVVHEPLQTEVFRRLPNIEREDNLVVFAGATVAGKGIGHLVKACDGLTERIPGLRLEVYGSAGLWREEQKEFIDWAELASRRPNIVHKGAVGKAELVHAFNRASLCVVPTDPTVYQEGYARVSSEAQGCGCPVIVSRSGGLPETMVDGETGVIVDPPDSEHLAAAIENLLGDDDRRRAMSRAAERHAHRFTVDDFARMVLRLVDSRAQVPNR